MWSIGPKAYINCRDKEEKCDSIAAGARPTAASERMSVSYTHLDRRNNINVTDRLANFFALIIVGLEWLCERTPGFIMLNV